MEIGRVSSGRTYLSQIIVDGKILVDDNITPQNAHLILILVVPLEPNKGLVLLNTLCKWI